MIPVDTEPADIAEFSWVRKQRRIALRAQHEPQVHVEMTIRAAGRRNREEERLARAERGMELRGYAKLLPRLPDDGLARVLARFDMPARRQPQAGLAMITEEQAAAGRVHGDEVDHQVLGRGVRRNGPEELLSRGNPREDAGPVSRLARVAGLDRRHEIRDKSAHVVVWHGPFLRSSAAAWQHGNWLPLAAAKRYPGRGPRHDGRAASRRCSSVGRASAL